MGLSFHLSCLLMPMSPGVHAPQEKPLQREAGAPPLKGSPRSPQLEKRPSRNEDPVQQTE